MRAHRTPSHASGPHGSDSGGSKGAQIAIFFTVMVDLLGFGIVLPLLPLYAREVSQNPSAWMAWVNGFLNLQNPGAFWAGVAFVSFSITQFLASPLLGRLSDLMGRKPVLWMTMAGSAMSYLLLGLSSDFEWILIARLLGGLMGGNISVAQAAMADLSPKKERSKAMGLIGAAFGLGFVLGPFLGGILSASTWGQHLASMGIQLPFMTSSLLSLIASLLVLTLMNETLPPEARMGARQEEKRGHALILALKRPGMAQILIISLLSMTGFAQMEGTYSLLAKDRFGLGAKEVGYLFGFVGLLIVIYQGGLVRLVSRFLRERTALIWGLGLMAIALPLLAFFPWKWPFVLIMIPLAWGSGMNNTASAALASQLTPPEDQGGLFGVINAMSGLGRILGPLLGTLLYAKWGYTLAYLIASALIATAGLVAFLLPTRTETESH